MDISTDYCTCWPQCIGGVSLLSAELSVEHSHSLRLGSGRPRCTEESQDRCIVLAVVAARTAYREEIRAHVAFAVSPRTTVNHLLAARLKSCVPMARLPLTPRHHQARLLWCRESVDWGVKWRSVLFSDESSFCLYARDGCTGVRRRLGERNLPECIRTRPTGSTPGCMAWGGHQLQLAVIFGFSAG